MQLAHAQIIEGTSEEIRTLLQNGVFAGQKLRVIIEPGEEEFAADLPNPPFTVQGREHLLALLREGIHSPAQPFTDETLEQMKQEVRTRITAKQQR